MTTRLIKTSLHGNRIGLDHGDNILIKGTKGDSPLIAVINPRSITKPVQLTDDFLGDLLDAAWDGKAGSDGAAVAPVIFVGTGGLVRLTSGAGAGATMAVNGSQLESSLNWKANKGHLSCEAYIALSAITTVSAFFGFTDQTTALEAPITSAASGDTLTSNATDAVGFMFDTSMANDYFWCVGVKNDVDATAVNTSIAPVAATYILLRIEVDTAGTATFYINGNRVAIIANAVTITAPLTPVLTVFRRAATSMTLDADYIEVKQDR